MKHGNLAARIAQATGVEPGKVTEVVQLAFEELHRIAIVDEKGPTAAVIEACFSFGDEAAFHLMGLYASEHDYHDREDEAGIWSETAMRLIPSAYRERCDRIAPWFSERAAARLRAAAGSLSSDPAPSEQRLVMIDEPNPYGSRETWERHLAGLKDLPENTMSRSEMIAHAEDMIERKRKEEGTALPTSPDSRPVSQNPSATAAGLRGTSGWAALVLGRAAKRIGLKYSDLGLVRAGMNLEQEANAALGSASSSPKASLGAPSPYPPAGTTSSSPPQAAPLEPILEWEEILLDHALLAFEKLKRERKLPPK
jgi:hypothetical protein